MEANNRELACQNFKSSADLEVLQAKLAAMKQSCAREKQDRRRNREILEGLHYQLEVGFQ